MTKQEKIRKGIADKFLNYQGTNYKHATKLERENALVMADNVVEVLHSQGVVIKVKRELPPSDVDDICTLNEVIWEYRIVLRKAGYVAVEPLIK